MKKCSKCQEPKSLKEFHKDQKRKDGLCSACKECFKKHYQKHKKTILSRNKKWRNSNPEKIKIYNTRKKEYELFRNYGLSLHDKNIMLSNQNSQCSICKISIQEHLEKYQKDFHVDHNHKTGKIRSLLCEKCNRGLGFFNDDFETLLEASKYLKFHSST